MENSNKEQKVIIYGDSDFAEQVYYQLDSDGRYNVLAFTVDETMLKKKSFYDLPVIPFQKLKNYYSTSEVQIFPAIGYSILNKIREVVTLEIENAGYKIFSYISKNAFIGANTIIGEGCFICEFVSIKPKTKIGKCVIIFPNTTIGHNVIIKDYVYFSICAAVGGNTIIERNSFIGMNSTLRDGINIGAYNVIGTASNIVKSTEPNGIYVGNPAKRLKNVDLENIKI